MASLSAQLQTQGTKLATLNDFLNPASNLLVPVYLFRLCTLQQSLHLDLQWNRCSIADPCHLQGTPRGLKVNRSSHAGGSPDDS
jgi:hypothetical protein